jgi:anti-sigma factor RsiW
LSHLRPEGDRNALLALHFDEGEPRTDARTRAHLETCARCREYLHGLGDVERQLRAWTDEPLPAYLADRLFARVARSVQVSVPRIERRAPALLALLPLMAVLMTAGRALADRLGALASWSEIAQWPGVALLGTSGVTVVLLLLGGGLLTLAIAPALMLESQRGRRTSLA